MPLSFGLFEFESEEVMIATRIILRVLAVAVGTAYFCSTIFLVFNAQNLSGIGAAFGWYAAAFAQLIVAVGFTGMGLGLWRLALNAKAR